MRRVINRLNVDANGCQIGFLKVIAGAISKGIGSVKIGIRNINETTINPKCESAIGGLGDKNCGEQIGIQIIGEDAFITQADHGGVFCDLLRVIDGNRKGVHHHGDLHRG